MSRYGWEYPLLLFFSQKNNWNGHRLYDKWLDNLQVDQNRISFHQQNQHNRIEFGLFLFFQNSFCSPHKRNFPFDNKNFSVFLCWHRAMVETIVIQKLQFMAIESENCHRPKAKNDKQIDQVDQTEITNFKWISHLLLVESMFLWILRNCYFSHLIKFI